MAGAAALSARQVTHRLDDDVRALRVTAVNTAPVRERGDYVLYWTIAARRTTWSFALDHAIARARELDRPLLVLEPLRAGYAWASDRLHAFALQGMADNARAFAAAGITYHAYVEPAPGEGRGLLGELARRARLIVTDELPGFFLPRMVAAAGRALDVRLEQVDVGGLIPLRGSERAYPSAAAFRRHVQRDLRAHLLARPLARPLARASRGLRDADLPSSVSRRWAAASPALLAAAPAALAGLAIDHDVPPVSRRGGSAAGGVVIDELIADRLARYAEEHQHPDADATSGLSPYLHFGHVSAHEVLARIWQSEDWDPARLAEAASGQREGWWGLSRSAELFLDELVTWRELALGACFHGGDHDRYASIPAWARRSLAEHARDPRPHRYTRTEFERAATHDELWNAAQRELLVDGRIHGYLRMLWGKKILEWSASPRSAFATMIELNNRHALDGRDASSYAGIAWVLGRYDRPWPERPIFGVVRAMTSESARRKLHLTRYLARWAAAR